jgi:two-component system sensor histidine kinase/response regulator
MSHEIRTPLNAITGMAYLIRGGGLSAAQPSAWTSSKPPASTCWASSTVLDLSKIEAGKFALEEVPCPWRASSATWCPCSRARQAKGWR